MTSGPEWTAIILAGQRPGENDFAMANGVPAKALIPIDGRPMLDRVARTVLASPSIARAVILAQAPQALLAGDLAWMADHDRIDVAAAKDGISRSIFDVAGSTLAPWPALVVTADHALLTGEMIEEFITKSDGADAAVAVVERRTVEAAYPETRRTWLRFSDGDYTGANLFALKKPEARRALLSWARVERDRKKVLRLLLHFGPVIALRGVTRTISLDRALATVGRRLGVKLAAVRMAEAEAAIDVDKPDDLELVRAIVARRRVAD